MFASSHKSILLVTGLFIGGFLFGQLWHYLGENDAIINRYLEVHNNRFITENNSNKIYYVFYNDIEPLTDHINKDSNFIELKPASMNNLATVTINNAGFTRVPE